MYANYLAHFTTVANVDYDFLSQNLEALKKRTVTTSALAMKIYLRDAK